MPDYKLVIRRLPPSMSEDEFTKLISPLPSHDYFCYFEANSSLRPHSFSRAYINFLHPDDMSMFRERFDNYIFLDKDGHEYPAVVEQSMWHKSPKNGPFYRQPETDTLPAAAAVATVANTPTTPTDAVKSSSNIEQDPDFIEFVEKMRAQKKTTPTNALETTLDEMSNQMNNSAVSGGKIITPLMSYVSKKRILKRAK